MFEDLRRGRADAQRDRAHAERVRRCRVPHHVAARVQHTGVPYASANNEPNGGSECCSDGGTDARTDGSAHRCSDTSPHAAPVH